MTDYECLKKLGVLSDGKINELALEMMMLCMEIKDDLDNIKGKSLAVTATHGLFVEKIFEVLFKKEWEHRRQNE